MAVPVISTRHAIMQTRHLRLLHFAARMEKNIDARVDMTPVGIARREDSIEVKPRFWMIIPLKVINPAMVSIYMRLQLSSNIHSPPFGMLMAILKKKMSHVLGS